MRKAVVSGALAACGAIGVGKRSRTDKKDKLVQMDKRTT
jgi:hypothetical protein